MTESGPSPIEAAPASPPRGLVVFTTLASIGLALLCLGDLAFWLPQYLLRPAWVDHDVFATMALGWDRGLLPYRDLLSNNFPGTVYLFWLVGKTIGWGRMWGFYALDVAFLLGLIVALLAWSRRVFGGVLPGLIGAATVLSYYLSRDYSLTAQRDWQAVELASIGLLLLQAWGGRGARIAAAALLAMALSIRPQVVLLGPAFLIALGRPIEGRVRWRAVVEFAAATALLTALLFLPLATAGVLGDFVASLRRIGSGYGILSPKTILKRFLTGLNDVPLIPCGAAAILLAALSDPGLGGTRRWAAIGWAAATAGLLLYAPLSPLYHLYLDMPLRLAGVAVAASLAGLVIGSARLPAAWKAGLLACLVGAGVKPLPAYVSPKTTAQALRALARIDLAPTAFEPPGVSTLDVDLVPKPPPPWEDYWQLMTFLRRELPPGARIANAATMLALCGPLARLPVFPSESIYYVFVIHWEAERRFVAALESAGDDSVVVWSIGPEIHNPMILLPGLRAVINDHYEPWATFGTLQVLKKRPKPVASATGRSQRPRGRVSHPG